MRSILKWRAAIVAVFCLAATIAAPAGNLPGLVTNWGDPTDGLSIFPGGILTNVTAVACGLSNNLALKADGTMVGWGAGTANTGSAPDYGQSIIPAGLSNVTAIAAGEYHSLALSNGTVLAWGFNNDGQTTVPSGLSSVTAIAAGSFHSMALKSNGTVVAWGFNGFGETNVPSGLTNAAAISAGDVHSLALESNGMVLAWGGDMYGQTNIPPGLTNVVAIAAGMDHSLALCSNGTVVAWGYNGFGQTNVPPTLSNVVAIAAGGHQSVAVSTGGVVTLWGSVSNLPAGLTNVDAVAACGIHGLAVTLNPVLVSQPPAEIFLGPSVNTNVGISIWSGTALRYQWLFDGAPIPQATAANLPVNNFGPAAAGAYAVLASNSFNYLTAATVLRLSNSPVVLVNGADVGGGTANIAVSAQITMTNTGSGSSIYYTLDGSTPDFTSIAYAGTFALTNSAVINAIAYNSSFTVSAQAAPINVQVNPIFPLAATTPGGGGIGISPPAFSGSNYVSNTVITLTATPLAGWTFLGWTGDSTATTNVITLTMTGPHTVQAVFGNTPNLAIVGNGQLTLNPSNGPYAYGSTVQITAMPAAGSYFFGWANGASGFNNPLLFTDTTTNGITALFGTLNANEVTLTALPIGSGTVTVSPQTNVFTNGETVTLTAVPAANFAFSAWGGSVPASATNPLVTILNSNEVITATFIAGAQTNAPVITQPPLSRTLGAGDSTLLSFQSTGTGPFTYQWSFDATNMAGATNPTLQLTSFTEDQAGLYAVSLTSPYGTANSTPASVALFNLLLVPSDSPPPFLPLLIVNGASGTSYQLEYSTNLSLGNWTLLDPVTIDGNAVFYVDTAPSNNPARFYRAVPQ